MTNWIKRKKTKVVNVGGVLVGGDNPISIQSMTNTNTCDVVSTVNQIKDLEDAGDGDDINVRIQNQTNSLTDDQKRSDERNQ